MIWYGLLLVFGINFGSAAQVQEIILPAGGISYRGLQNSTSGLASYYGIPYATPPLNELRWKPPVPLDTYAVPNNTVDATTRGPVCLQSTPPWSVDSSAGMVQSEDCLVLDVITPSSPTSGALPVMVQIHGGGYVTGSTITSPGESLVYHSRGNLIYVAIQYRLGPLGFLGGQEVSQDGSWNVGLLDQRLALEWVQNNIHYFGGDASKVTIAGGSAGGSSVTLQLMLRGGEDSPPFRAAIPEYPWWTPIYDDDWLQAQYHYFRSAANCTDLQCLRGLSTSDIQAATSASYTASYADGQFAYGTFYWGPAIDGVNVLGHPVTEFQSGHFSKVPALIDHDGQEGYLFSNFSLTTEDQLAADLHTLWQGVPDSFVEEVLTQYPSITRSSNGTVTNVTVTSRRRSIFADAVVNCGTTSIASAIKDSALPIYKMVFEAGTGFHGATGPFLFSTDINPSGDSTLGTLPSPGNSTLASLMRDYFVSFAIFLGPNNFHTNNTSSYWPQYTSAMQTLRIGSKGITVSSDPDNNSQCNLLALVPSISKSI